MSAAAGEVQGDVHPAYAGRYSSNLIHASGFGGRRAVDEPRLRPFVDPLSHGYLPLFMPCVVVSHAMVGLASFRSCAVLA